MPTPAPKGHGEWPVVCPRRSSPGVHPPWAGVLSTATRRDFGPHVRVHRLSAAQLTLRVWGSVIWPFSHAACQQAWLGLLCITFDLRGAGGDFGMVPLGESVFRTQEGPPPGLPDQV